MIDPNTHKPIHIVSNNIDIDEDYMLSDLSHISLLERLPNLATSSQMELQTHNARRPAPTKQDYDPLFLSELHANVHPNYYKSSFLPQRQQILARAYDHQTEFGFNAMPNLTSMDCQNTVCSDSLGSRMNKYPMTEYEKSSVQARIHPDNNIVLDHAPTLDSVHQTQFNEIEDRQEGFHQLHDFPFGLLLQELITEANLDDFLQEM